MPRHRSYKSPPKVEEKADPAPTFTHAVVVKPSKKSNHLDGDYEGYNTTTQGDWYDYRDS